MNYRLLAPVLVAALIGVTAFAQEPANVPSNGPGLLGRRYFGAGITYGHFHSVRYTDAEGVSADLNLPVAPGLDAAFNYDFSHVMGSQYSRPEHVFGASLVAYTQDEYGKPFFVAGLEQDMRRTRIQGVLDTHNDTLWLLGAGLETTFGSDTAITYRLDYSRPITNGQVNPTLRYKVQANHWFTSRLAGVVSFTYCQIAHAPDELLYTAGVRVLF